MKTHQGSNASKIATVNLSALQKSIRSAAAQEQGREEATSYDRFISESFSCQEGEGCEITQGHIED